MGLFDILHILIIAFYALGTVLFLTGVCAGNDRLKTLAVWLAVAGFTLNTADLSLALTGDPLALSSGTFYFNILAWCVLAVYFFLWWRLRLEFLAITALPLALLLYVASLALGGIRVVMPPELTMLFFGLHIGTLILTLGVLIMAFGAAVAFIYYNRKLKTKAGLSSMGQGIPSLDKFDAVNRLAVTIGFPLFTLGLFSTYFWYLIDAKRPFAWDIMKIGSFAVWFLFAFLFHQRVVLGWRGRKPAILAIWVFAGMCVSLIHHTITFRAVP
ncbi:MAG: cytochrome c biogenesis protein CcsA [Pseudodesulfovibrio sp.]|uniref:Cytochrome c assembly protein n=1 Tax=Pseudodesulfovibrio aespoeensis (strain ATCC 700646 / DSM 10631 / Aspo-2) TaxID=643562 RepID=E6VWP9_PSEA9|nr:MULTISPECIES: cytochrome c biogenesis protein CcsA [Pseudodesulfovibrio]MBU4191804.1 cytochrome c biogenesis protein CcsA [Pseudomonadota bacterium]ADU62550.1 cytochrome c assembly protein [Pseudodesulfovibrio aespoeensis Aspo-2]MBU4243899.1 cytochrome c biogenesis protein CcsA [Pseudomonadota bacterium]MBU4379661.1 cytochrome c biogenesis protein CcsA [Pseudomonadota bacterium]MBU4476262.1 cytochrome c biogenesis protein CcsA [Pseudomonadota bacterium]